MNQPRQPSSQRVRLAVTTAMLAAGLGALAIVAQASVGESTAIPGAFRGVDWKSLSVPSGACDTGHSVRLVNGSATAASRHWPGVRQVELYLDQESYGELGAGASAAAVDVWCSGPGGMADDQLADVWVIYTANAGHLQLIGVVSARAPATKPGVHTSVIGAVNFRRGAIVADEAWYKPSDPTCCPSGRATSTWTYSNGALTYRGTSVAR